MILERTLCAERTGFWHYGESLLGSLEFTEKLFLHSLAFCDNKYLINYKFKRRYVCLGQVFLCVWVLFFSVYQSAAFLLMTVLTELVNKK